MAKEQPEGHARQAEVPEEKELEEPTSSSRLMKKKEKKVKKEKKSKKKGQKKDKKEREKAKKSKGKGKKRKLEVVQISSGSSSSSGSESSSRCPKTLQSKIERVASTFRTAVEANDQLRVQHLVKRYGMGWQDCKGEGALHIVAKLNKPGLAAWLLRQPSAPELVKQRNHLGETPLLVATRMCRGCIALRLVEALADPAAADHEGESPEALDLDGLIREAERDQACKQAAEEERLLAAVNAARRLREEKEWRRRLFEGLGEEDFCRFGGHEDLEREDQALGSVHWMDAIRMEAERRAAAEASAAGRAAAAAVELAKTKAEANRAAQQAAPPPGLGAGERPPGSQAAGAAGSIDDDEARERAEEARLSGRARDEKAWAALESKVLAAEETESSGIQLREGDIPWPSGPPSNPLRVEAKSHPAVLRSQLRAGLLRWHPDKFEQKLGRFLPAAEKERTAILGRVKALAQQLTQQMATMLPTGVSSS